MKQIPANPGESVILYLDLFLVVHRTHGQTRHQIFTRDTCTFVSRFLRVHGAQAALPTLATRDETRAAAASDQTPPHPVASPPPCCGQRISQSTLEETARRAEVSFLLSPSGRMGRSSKQTQVTLGLLAAVLASVALWYAYSNFQKEETEQESGKQSSKAVHDTPTKSAKKLDRTSTPLVSNKSRGKEEEKSLHSKIEELDKRGKALFKAKKHLEAAQAFTEALDLIEAQGGSQGSTSLARQVLTLTNNRSAMYEKGGLADLALEDCRTILEEDVGHSKARMRRLRILESQDRYREALVEVCALQLRFLQENREKLRLGIPVNPPVPQSKLEDLMQNLLPQEIELQLQKTKGPRPLPSNHTILQLLRSFTGYNSWMAAAAKDGSVDNISNSLAKGTDSDIAKRASLIFRRGRRHAYDGHFDLAKDDFEQAFAMVEDDTNAQDDMPGDDFARLLEWVGMVRHWTYNLDGALKCYERCSDLDPTNVSICLGYRSLL